MCCTDTERKKAEIIDFLPPELKDIPIVYSHQVGSTNDEAKKLSGSYDRLIYIADSQSGGRGRMGRSFFSPAETGIYMSILLHPSFEAELCPLLTPACAVAAAEAIESVLGIKTGIKWVNDIYLGDRKVAGILTEGAFSEGKADYAVVGIGINLSAPVGDFPEDIKNIASALTDSTLKKQELTAEIISRFLCYADSLSQKNFLPSYKKRLLFVGEEITVISPSESYNGRVEGVNDMCHLTVKTESGEKKTLCSGEISIRRLNSE